MHVSIRPEKFSISLDKPQTGPKQNVLPATVEDIVYQGDHTRYWVSIAPDWRVAVTRQHNRFMLDERPITWGDKVFISWQSDDGFMLEHYSEKDEDLLQMPPQQLGEESVSDEEATAAPAGVEAGNSAENAAEEVK